MLGQYSTSYYAKLFLLMIIPVYGLCFTLLLAFGKNVDGELRSLAKGALIARLVFLFVLGVGLIILFTTILPVIRSILNDIGVLRLLS